MRASLANLKATKAKEDKASKAAKAKATVDGSLSLKVPAELCANSAKPLLKMCLRLIL